MEGLQLPRVHVNCCASLMYPDQITTATFPLQSLSQPKTRNVTDSEGKENKIVWKTGKSPKLTLP